MKSAAVGSLIALLPSLLCAEVTRARYLMGTICEITVPESPRAEKQMDAAFEEAQRVERFLSTWREDSELSRVNGGRTTVLSRELAQILEAAMSWSAATGGAFNPLVRPLIDVWRTRSEGAVPEKRALVGALARVAVDNVRFNESGIELNNGARFEEGAFGKGYAIDTMLAVLRREGAAAALINFGGQLGTFGERREVSIADPSHRDRPLLSVSVADGSLSTSSGSEKSFTVNGRRFTHIIDPRTGEAIPPRGSVSVLHRSAFVADILSTALYVMGADEGLCWAREHDITAIFIAGSGQIITSKEVH